MTEPPPFYPVAYLARIPLFLLLLLLPPQLLLLLLVFLILLPRLIPPLLVPSSTFSSSPLLLRSPFFPLLLVGAGENRGPGPIRTRKSANPVITYGRDN